MTQDVKKLREAFLCMTVVAVLEWVAIVYLLIR